MNPPKKPIDIILAPTRNVRTSTEVPDLDVNTLFSYADSADLSGMKQLILEKRVPVSKMINGKTLFHSVLLSSGSSELEKLECIEFLVQRGANLGTANTNGETPLHLAVEYQYEKIVEFITKKGISINMKTNKDMTPLHYACRLILGSCPNVPEKTPYEIFVDKIYEVYNSNEKFDLTFYKLYTQETKTYNMSFEESFNGFIEKLGKFFEYCNGQSAQVLTNLELDINWEESSKKLAKLDVSIDDNSYGLYIDRINDKLTKQIADTYSSRNMNNILVQEQTLDNMHQLKRGEPNTYKITSEQVPDVVITNGNIGNDVEANNTIFEEKSAVNIYFNFIKQFENVNDKFHRYILFSLLLLDMYGMGETFDEREFGEIEQHSFMTKLHRIFHTKQNNNVNIQTYRAPAENNLNYELKSLFDLPNAQSTINEFYEIIVEQYIQTIGKNIDTIVHNLELTNFSKDETLKYLTKLVRRAIKTFTEHKIRNIDADVENKISLSSFQKKIHVKIDGTDIPVTNSGTQITKLYSDNYRIHDRTNVQCLKVNTNIIKLLIQSGAVPSIQDSSLKTSYDYIIESRLTDVLSDSSIKSRLFRRSNSDFLIKAINQEIEHDKSVLTFKEKYEEYSRNEDNEAVLNSTVDKMSEKLNLQTIVSKITDLHKLYQAFIDRIKQRSSIDHISAINDFDTQFKEFGHIELNENTTDEYIHRSIHEILTETFDTPLMNAISEIFNMELPNVDLETKIHDALYKSMIIKYKYNKEALVGLQDTTVQTILEKMSPEVRNPLDLQVADFNTMIEVFIPILELVMDNLFAFGNSLQRFVHNHQRGIEFIRSILQ